jgi:hypothetical protein
LISNKISPPRPSRAGNGDRQKSSFVVKSRQNREKSLYDQWGRKLAHPARRRAGGAGRGVPASVFRSTVHHVKELPNKDTPSPLQKQGKYSLSRRESLPPLKSSVSMDVGRLPSMKRASQVAQSVRAKMFPEASPPSK